MRLCLILPVTEGGGWRWWFPWADVSSCGSRLRGSALACAACLVRREGAEEDGDVHWLRGGILQRDDVAAISGRPEREVVEIDAIERRVVRLRVVGAGMLQVVAQADGQDAAGGNGESETLAAREFDMVGLG